MLYVVGAILTVIILFIIGVSYSQMQDSKKQEEKQSSLNEQVRQIQNSFREQASKLSNEGLVTPQVRHKYTSIASNFFVFQSINESNLIYLQSLTDMFSTLMEVINNTPESEELINHLEQTAHKIPAQARDFTAHFYANVAPKLIAELMKNIEAIGQAPDEEENAAEDNGDNDPEQETENSNEQELETNKEKAEV